jgi:hypothetical protein
MTITFCNAFCRDWFACKHDFDEPDGNNSLTVAGAQAWYEANWPGRRNLRLVG